MLAPESAPDTVMLDATAIAHGTPVSVPTAAGAPCARGRRDRVGQLAHDLAGHELVLSMTSTAGFPNRTTVRIR